MVILLDPNGNNERVTFSYEGTDSEEENYLFKMTITDTGINLQPNITYRFIMSESPFSSTITREMLNSDPSLIQQLKKTSIPEKIYDISSNEGNAYEFTIKIKIYPGTFIAPTVFPYNEILLYGEQTNDFKLVNKDTIFALHHLSIQELLRNTSINQNTTNNIIGVTNLFSDTWNYAFTLNGTMRVAWFTNYTPTNGNYIHNNPTNSPDATGSNMKGTHLKITFVVPKSQRVLIKFVFPLHPIEDRDVYNFKTTLSSSSTEVIPLRTTGILDDYYRTHTHASKTNLDHANYEILQYILDTSKHTPPIPIGDTMTVYLCANGQSLGNSHKMAFGAQNINGNNVDNRGNGAITVVAYSLDNVNIYEPNL